MATNTGGNLSTGPEVGPNSLSLRLSECLCPICISILIEPVSMPCNHELCMPCFKQNVEEANFTCPMCRLRISNWARRAVRENRLINQKRWQEILAAFPEQCRKRLDGEEDDDEYLDDEEIHRPAVCKPGEIREEYETELQKIQKQRQEEAEREVQRSEEYIQKLQAEEVRNYEEQRQKQEKLKREDEELARKLAEDLLEETRQRQLDKQAEEDARLAWTLQCEEQMMQSPRVVSTNSHSSSNSSGCGKKSRSRSSSNSSVKCLRIDTFLTPTAKNKVQQSHSPDDTAEKFDINMPSTSKNTVVLTPSPSSNLSFGSDISKPGPSGIAQLVPSNSNLNSESFFFDISKAIPLTRTSSDQSVRSENGSDISFEKPSTSALPAMDDLLDLDPKGPQHSDLSQENDLQRSPRSISEPCLQTSRSSSVQSHTSTTSAPCHATRSKVAVKENIEETTHVRGRRKKKGGAFHTYTASATGQDRQGERERSDSLSSVDSISHELSHFRPIQSSPRTARKKLANGSRESPPIIQATPRNLKDMKTPVGTESPFIDPPPLVRAKIEKLVEERYMVVEATSKATMTVSKGVEIQHWKKIARPEARKTDPVISANTKRKLSRFEYSSDATEGLMQPPKYQRIDSMGYGRKGKQKRTIGTQKGIPVKKRQVPSIETNPNNSQSSIDDAMQRIAVNLTKSGDGKVHIVTCSGDSDQPKNASMLMVQPKAVDLKTAIDSSVNVKRKILIDDDKGDKLGLNSILLEETKVTSSSAAEKGKLDKSSDQSLDQSPFEISPGHSSSSSDTNSSKVYKMRVKVSPAKNGSKLTVKNVQKLADKKPSEDIAKRKEDKKLPEDVAKRKVANVKRKLHSLPLLPSLPMLPTTGTVVDTAQSKVEDKNKSGNDKMDINQSPENHRRGLRSQKCRNGTSPSKGILVETIQNGSKKENSLDLHVVTKYTRKVRDIKAIIDHEVKNRISPALNQTLPAKPEAESPRVKRSPRSCKKRAPASPNVSASPCACKKTFSPPPPLKSLKSGSGVLKSPRMERRNTLWKYMELMTEEQKKIKQEEEDRRIALQLQKEFDKQEKKSRNNVIRKKGTKDAYRLRDGSSSSVP